MVTWITPACLAMRTPLLDIGGAQTAQHNEVVQVLKLPLVVDWRKAAH